MAAEPVSVLDIADHAGKRKQTVFKVLARLKIKATKQRSSRGRGQLVAYVTAEEAKRVLEELQARAEAEHADEDNRNVELAVSDAEIGVFYLLALEPEHDPGRFKVGFAVGLAERLRHLKCSAPLLKVIGKWPCKRLWEKTAIDAVTVSCEQLHTEVFRTSSISTVSERCEKFFAQMPGIPSKRSERN